MERARLLSDLRSGAMLDRLRPVYGTAAEDASARLIELIREAASVFPAEDGSDVWLFSTPGRTELGGNHTDHQHGRCLAAAVDMDTIACVIPNNAGVVRVKSRHHRMAETDLRDLAIHPEETGSSAALVRGVAARLTQMGFTLGGFDAYTTTNVLRGSGLSSSAAFEVLTGEVMNSLFCGGSLTPVQLALAGQYAENVYYGKPCGCIDHLSCALGGVVDADFRDPEAPLIRRLPLDLASQGYALCIVDSRASHADLTEDYAAITSEMRQVAGCFGREVLGDVDPREVMESLSLVRATCGDRAALRAYHFFRENRRVALESEALEKGDIGTFLTCVRESGRSSFMYLQNVTNYRESRQQPIALLLAVAEDLLGDEGAARVHGGGFAGTIQAYVPVTRLGEFVLRMEAVAGQGACHVVGVRETGSVLLLH